MGVFSQLLINGLLAGATYALIASGFSLLYNVQKFVDISYGAMYVVAAFLTYFFFKELGIFFIGSTILAFIITSLIGILSYRFIFDPLRKSRENKLSLLLASFGLFTLIEGIILLIFGAGPKSYGFGAKQGISVMGANITILQIWIIVVSLVVLVLLNILLKKSRLGIALRAISDNKVIASTLGISFNKISVISIIIGAFLASLSGVLVGLDRGIFHTMGLNAILIAFTAAIVGGISNIPAAMLGGFLIGLIENFGILYLPSEFKVAIPFIVLILFLLFRPHGIFGVKAREEFAG